MLESNQLRAYYRDVKMRKELFLLTYFRRDEIIKTYNIKLNTEF